MRHRVAERRREQKGREQKGGIEGWREEQIPWKSKSSSNSRGRRNSIRG